MFKRLLSALCCLMLLCSFALAEEPLVLTKTKDKEILRVEGEKRFVNDAAGIFTTDRMEKLVNAYMESVYSMCMKEKTKIVMESINSPKKV